MLGFAPCVRCPPEARSMARKVSPGCRSARKTAWLAWLPEFGLHVGEARAEELAGPLDRQRLGHVDELAAAVVAPARIALGVLVRHHRALRLEHGAADDVLRGDQLDLVALAAELARGWRRRSPASRAARSSVKKPLSGRVSFTGAGLLGRSGLRVRYSECRGRETRKSSPRPASGGEPATRLEFAPPGGQDWRLPQGAELGVRAHPFRGQHGRARPGVAARGWSRRTASGRSRRPT